MPRYQATLLIELKKGILDPQGRAVEGVLKDLGHPVEEVRVGKVLEIVFPAENLLEAEEKAKAMGAPASVLDTVDPVDPADMTPFWVVDPCVLCGADVK